MSRLTRSKDRKVTNAVTPSGAPAIANAFGLPAGKGYSCPAATDFCSKVCYAGKLEKVYKGVKNVLVRNWDMLKDADLDQATELLDEMIWEFERDCEKRKAPKLFRIHWDGDFFGPTYTAAWSRVIANHPEVKFWAYTRVATAALFLHAQDHMNLSLYFSADRDNVGTAEYLDAKGILIAYVDETFDAGKAAFPKATRCPENNGAMPLITDKGSACVRCGLCVNGRNDVLFSTTKK